MSRSIGPALPPGFVSQQSNEEEEEEHARPGPAPSNAADSATPQGSTIGPHIPSEHVQSYGPALPPGLEARQLSPTHSESESDSDDEVIGPMPSAAGVKVLTHAPHEMHPMAFWKLNDLPIISDTSRGANL